MKALITSDPAVRKAIAMGIDKEGFVSGLLLAILPPGAFILLGCLIAAKNWLEARRAARQHARAALSLQNA